MLDTADPVVPAVETPAAPVVPAAPPAAKPAEDDYHAELAANIAATQAVLTAKDEPPAEAPVEIPAETPVPEVTEPAVGEEPAAVEEPASTETPAVVAKTDDQPAPVKRMRMKTERDELIAGMKTEHPDWTWARCEEAVNGPAVETPAAAEVNPLDTRLAEVRTKLDEHAAAGDLLSPEFLNALREENAILRKIELEQELAPIRQKEADREAKIFKDDRAASVERVQKASVAMYQEGTPLHQKAQETYANMQNPEHPDYIPNIAKKANAPELVYGRALNSLAEEIAARDGISFADAYAAQKGNPISVQQAQVAAPKATSPVTAARKPVVTAPGNVATRTPDRAKTPAELQAEFDAMDPIDRFKALYPQFEKSA